MHNFAFVAKLMCNLVFMAKLKGNLSFLGKPKFNLLVRAACLWKFLPLGLNSSSPDSSSGVKEVSRKFLSSSSWSSLLSSSCELSSDSSLGELGLGGFLALSCLTLRLLLTPVTSSSGAGAAGLLLAPFFLALVDFCGHDGWVWFLPFLAGVTSSSDKASLLESGFFFCKKKQKQ